MFKRILELQYQFSKLFLLGVDRAVYEAVTRDELKITSNSKNTYSSLFFYGVGSFLFLGSLIEFWSGSDIEDLSKGDQTAMFFVLGIHLIFSLLCFRHFLWLIRGKHIIRLNSSSIEIDYEGTFLVSKKAVAISEIEDVLIIEEPSDIMGQIQKNLKLAQRVFLNKTVGQITMKTADRRIKLFSSLSNTQKMEVFDLLNNYISKVKYIEREPYITTS